MLLTGATGFIGRYALPLLVSHGHEVHAVTRRVRAAGEDSGVIWHEFDLLDTAAAPDLLSSVGPALLLHLAWDVEPGRFWTSVENVRWVEATLALMRAFFAAGGERATLAGTCAEYDWTTGFHPADEPGPPLHEQHTPIAPATLYGVCKHATHLVAAELAEHYERQLAWGRVFYLYGPHEQAGRLVPAIATSLLAGEPTATTDGFQRRDFMHVADVAAAFVALLESDVEGPVNIATGDAVEVREMVSMIAAQAGHEELLRWGAIARAPTDPDVIVADVERLRREVGFAPAVPLANGLRETVEWWRERLAAAAAPGASA